MVKKIKSLQYMFHFNIVLYEHILIPEAVNICPMLRVGISNVGNVKDGVFSWKLESNENLNSHCFISCIFWGKFQETLDPFSDKNCWLPSEILLCGHKIFYKPGLLFMKMNLPNGLLLFWMHKYRPLNIYDIESYFWACTS